MCAAFPDHARLVANTPTSDAQFWDDDPAVADAPVRQGSSAWSGGRRWTEHPDVLVETAPVMPQMAAAACGGLWFRPADLLPHP